MEKCEREQAKGRGTETIEPHSNNSYTSFPTRLRYKASEDKKNYSIPAVFRKQKSKNDLTSDGDDDKRELSSPLKNMLTKGININSIPGVRTSKKITHKMKHFSYEKGMHLNRYLAKANPTTRFRNPYTFAANFNYEVEDVAKPLPSLNASSKDIEFDSKLNEVIRVLHGFDMGDLSSFLIEKDDTRGMSRTFSALSSVPVISRGRTASADSIRQGSSMAKLEEGFVFLRKLRNKTKFKAGNAFKSAEDIPQSKNRRVSSSLPFLMKKSQKGAEVHTVARKTYKEVDRTLDLKKGFIYTSKVQKHRSRFRSLKRFIGPDDSVSDLLTSDIKLTKRNFSSMDMKSASPGLEQLKESSQELGYIKTTKSEEVESNKDSSSNFESEFENDASDFDDLLLRDDEEEELNLNFEDFKMGARTGVEFVPSNADPFGVNNLVVDLELEPNEEVETDGERSSRSEED